MRIMVFFDLPTETNADKRQYRKFRSTLIKNGFIMLQESVYARMVPNASVLASVKEMLRKNKPENGLVQALTVTEKQFASMEYISGSFSTDVITTDERLLIL